jgi:hypothetical protein
MKRGLRVKGIAAAASAFAHPASRGFLTAKFFAPFRGLEKKKIKNY